MITIACPTPDCEGSPTREHLATLRPDGLAHTFACPACEWRGDLCDACNQPMAWDPTARGRTCGELDLVGALVCCGDMVISKLSQPADQATGVWHLAKGGRSLNAAGVRIRAEGQGSDVYALMLRISKLPELERELEELRRIRAT